MKQINLLFLLVFPIFCFAQNNKKLEYTFKIGSIYHTPLFSLSPKLDAILSPSARSSAGFERAELVSGAGIYFIKQRIEISTNTFLGKGELYSFGVRQGDAINRVYENRVFWSQSLVINKFNKPRARHVFYYGIGVSAINIGQSFNASLKAYAGDPNPVSVRVPMHCNSFSMQMGRGVGKYGFSRNLILEVKGEYIPNWGRYIYTNEISWLRFGASLHYRFPPRPFKHKSK
ncbi:MAG: hypothetical protein K2X48_17385 [Chitinophagaceae bacterium]|nr:hypothetical protein [Chitinophagaceae bacterium]